MVSEGREATRIRERIGEMAKKEWLFTVEYDADDTSVDQIAESLNALIDYAVESRLGYSELESVTVTAR